MRPTALLVGVAILVAASLLTMSAMSTTGDMVERRDAVVEEMGRLRTGLTAAQSACQAELRTLRENLAAAQGRAAPAATCVPEARAPARTATGGRARDLVLGLAAKLDLQMTSAFLRSLRQESPARVVIFVGEESDEIREMAAAFGVDMIPYTDAELGPWKSFHPSTFRWLLYQRFLQAHEGEFSKILVADVRDVVFQSDPFDVVEEEAVYAFQEAAVKRIKECGWNKGWVQDCFGPEGLREVGNFIISCSGTTIGAAGPMQIYIDQMAYEIGNRTKCERNGIDQGVHNVLVRTARLTDKARVIMMTNEDGPVATMQSVKTLRQDRFGRVLNEKGDVAAIVHQYDRHKPLSKQFKEMFPYRGQ